MPSASAYVCLGLALNGLILLPAHAAPLDPVAAAVAEGTGHLDLRYRYEHVDQQDFSEAANASTLRIRYRWTSGAIGGWNAALEADHVAVVGAERYHSSANGKLRYPVVPDPEGFDLNQAYLRHTGVVGTFTAGRQRILHGRERFVGGGSWRQNEQTFDALRMTVEPREGLRVDYAYVANVNRLFGPDDGIQPARWRSDSHLLTAGTVLSAETVGAVLTVDAFGYLLDFANDNGPANANATFGTEGTLTLGPAGLTVALARQTDHADNPVDYRAIYAFVEGTLALKPMTLSLGWERFGSDHGEAAFRTPLATQHKFQGWADRFSNPPDAGVRDAYLSVHGTRGPAQVTVTYHRFEADAGGADYGRELDLAVGYQVSRRLHVEMKYADYRSDGFATDTRKAWITMNLAL